MEHLWSVARYIARWHRCVLGTQITEMKLHKLLYFTQREAYILTYSPLFNEDFQAWQYGPVLPSIRSNYTVLREDTELPIRLSERGKFIIDSALREYGHKDAWSLSRLSHGEYAWINARKGLSYKERGVTVILKEDIAEDANRVRFRRLHFKQP